MELETVLDTRAIIGESALWDADREVLYWADIKAPALHCHDPASQQNRCWPVTSDLGAFALLEDGGALVALREGLFRLDLGSGALDRLAAPPHDPALFRFNEGACDAEGRFWVGVMFDPVAGPMPARSAQLHSFTLANGLRAENDWAELHNGFAWTADSRRFFLSHSRERHIYQYEFDAAAPDGRSGLGARTLFATVPPDLGIPDGGAVDSEGGYWCCLHRGGRLRRYHSDGSVDRDIPLPVSQPTMCAFAGPDLDILYITSASDDMSPGEHRAEPLAGVLLRCRPGVKGIPRPWIAR